MCNLTRDEQDEILVPVVVAYHVVGWEFGDGSYRPDLMAEVNSFRAALRLDDKSLDLAIAYGAHRNPWRSVVIK